MRRFTRLLYFAVATALVGALVPTSPAPACSLRTQPRIAGVAAVAPSSGGGGARLLYCDSLTKSYDGKRYQFRDISLGVASGARIGLVGVNGVGKSTLMKCLAGLEAADEGSVRFEGRPVVLYVEQEPARGQDSAGGAEWTVADALTEPMVAGPSASTPAAIKTAEALRAVRSFWAANERGSGDEEAEEAMAAAVEAMTAADGWELDQERE